MASESEDEFDEFADDRKDENYIDGVFVPPPPPPPKFSGDGTGERLVITFIENDNFKSYAGSQFLGPFHKSFSSVVGPNGSGKSNVIDSMLFVFGYRAQKLRSKKLSVLIHKSDRFPNLDYCRVTVHFGILDDKGGDDYDILENSVFSISREARKDNSSFYTIKELQKRLDPKDPTKVQYKEIQKKCNFREVAAKLSSHGIDLRYNRFLILQGEVEQISLMKPKAENEDEVGFLEFLEEIIGSNRLKQPIEQLFGKVHEANEMRVEKFNRFRAISSEKDALEVAKDEAVAYLQQENQKITFQHELFQYYRHQSFEMKEKAKEAFEEYEKKFAVENSKVLEVQEERRKKEEEMENFNKEHQNLITALEEANEKFKAIERQDIDIRAQALNTKEKGKKLVNDIMLEKEKLEKLKDEPMRLEAEKKIQEEKKVDLEKKIVEAEEKLTVAMNSIQDDTKVLQVEKDNKEKELFEYQKSVNDDEGEMNIAASELDLLKNKETKEKSLLQSLKSKVDHIEKELNGKQERIESNSELIPEYEEKMTEIDKQLEQSQTTMNELHENSSGLIARLEDLRASSSANASRNKIVNFLLQQKNRGTLQGVYGRLGDLGGIDKKYDCAISTACGQLDFIVVDSIDNAQACVEALKRNDIGSTTFIALDKMEIYRKRCSPMPNGTPENVPRLFDLVQVKDEQIRPAFYFALRDTLVANDLEQATRIAFGKKGGQRWRVVTLDGKLVDPSGAMTAGGRPSKGRMGTVAVSTEGSEKEIKSLENQVQQNKSQIEQLRNRIESLRKERKQLEIDLDVMLKNKDQFLRDLEVLRAELKCNEDQIQNQEQLVKNLPPQSKLNEMEKNVDTLREKYERSKSKANKVEIIVKELDGKIQAIIDKKIGSVKSSIESLKKELNSTNSILLKNQVAEKSNARNLEKCEAKIVSLDAEISKCQDKRAELKAKLKAFAEEALAVNEKYRELDEQKSGSEKELKDMQSQIDVLKKQEAKYNMANVDMKFELDKLETKLKEKEHEVAGWNRKMNELKLHVLDQNNPPEFRQLTDEELVDINPNYLSKQIQNLDADLKKAKPNLAAIEQYRKVEAIYIERADELTTITTLRDARKQNYERLKTQRLEEFRQGFITISRKLKEMYRMITLGGDAELEWQDSLDPFSEGINFTVRPNKKSWKAITNLSGGEKTLSSLSLIFALHYFKPSPLYVMDEIDAALDFRNVSIVANYIKQRTKNTQFIIISLRNNMYELANKLIGIYKVNNCTRSICFDPTGVEETELVKAFQKKATKIGTQEI